MGRLYQAILPSWPWVGFHLLAVVCRSHRINHSLLILSMTLEANFARGCMYIQDLDVILYTIEPGETSYLAYIQDLPASHLGPGYAWFALQHSWLSYRPIGKYIHLTGFTGELGRIFTYISTRYNQSINPRIRACHLPSPLLFPPHIRIKTPHLQEGLLDRSFQRVQNVHLSY